MKNIVFITLVIILIVSFSLNAYIDSKKIQERDDQIKELERQVFDLKLKQHTDSTIRYHVGEIRKKLGLPAQ